MLLGFGFFLWGLMAHLYMALGDDLVCGPFDCLASNRSGLVD
jgi:hypothetical protein